MKYNLKFIAEEDLYKVCKDTIEVMKKANEKVEKELHKNIVDPFSAIFDASYNNISLTEWLKGEKIRQVQKTFQNQIGVFHQKLIGKINGWKDLGTGSVIDLVNKEKKIIAEIKNKFNTTKGNHKVAIYDDLKQQIESEYKNYTGYYVAILTKKRFEKQFTPSDNRTHSKREKNEKIKEIDGMTFYELATGEKNAIKQLYQSIPFIIAEITNNDKNKIIKDPLFEELFSKAFK